MKAMEEQQQHFQELMLHRNKKIEEQKEQIKKNEEIIQKQKKALAAQQNLAAGSFSSVCYADFAEKFKHSTEIVKFDWFSKSNQTYSYEMNGVISIDTTLEAQIQQLFNEVLQYSNLPLNCMDTSDIPYIKESQKPDLTFISPSLVTYDNSVLIDFALAVGELKNSTEDIQSNTNLGELLFYLYHLALKNRTHIYGFICNFDSIIFVKMNSNFTVKRTNVLRDVFCISGNIVQVNYIGNFLREVKETSHFVIPEKFNYCKIIGHLGSGKTSCVYELKYMHTDTELTNSHYQFNSSNSYVLKVKNQRGKSLETFDEEAQLTRQALKCSKHKNCVPEIGFYDANFILFCQKYTRLQSCHLSEKVINQFLEFLDEMRKANILHRDIKPANLMYDDQNDCIVLIDFGFAITQNLAPFAGTITFAAEELLRSLITDSFMNMVEYLSHYDMESFIKSIFCLKYEPSAITKLHMVPVADHRQFITKLQKVSQVWRDVETDNPKLQHVLQQVRKGNIPMQKIIELIID